MLCLQVVRNVVWYFLAGCTERLQDQCGSIEGHLEECAVFTSRRNRAKVGPLMTSLASTGYRRSGFVLPLIIVIELYSCFADCRSAEKLILPGLQS